MTLLPLVQNEEACSRAVQGGWGGKEEIRYMLTDLNGCGTGLVSSYCK